MSARHVHHAHARTFRPRPPDCLLTAHLVCLHADKTASPGPGDERMDKRLAPVAFVDLTVPR
jgi:hypothetical protein